MSSKSGGAKKRAANDGRTIIADNRKARFNYAIEDVFEAGLELAGTEVKSLRLGKASLNEAYASTQGGDLYLLNGFIPEYAAANRFNHQPRRARRLLMHRREISRLTGAIEREGYTLIPLKLYFNARGIAKLELALAKGKKLHDKRETEKRRSWDREKARLLREKG